MSEGLSTITFGRKGNIMSEILILKSDFDDYEKFYIDHMQMDNVKTFGYLRTLNRFFKAIGIIWTKYFQLPLASIWYGKWKKKLGQYSTIILFDRILGWKIVDYIKKKNPKCRIIIWYWNSGKPPIPSKYQGICEGWSFDEKECQKFGYKYNIQFSFRDLKRVEMPIKQDCFFVGMDKGRYPILSKIQQIFDKYDISSKICVIKDKSSVGNKKVYCAPLNYCDVLNEVQSSKCIIDITKNGQCGETLRVLEAIFFEKKLITTDKNIVTKPYYKKNNIFILGIDNEIELKKFIDSPYDRLDNTIIQNYSFEKWIENFKVNDER